MTLAEQLASLRRTLHRQLARELASRSERPFQQLQALRAVAREGISRQGDLAERLLVDAPAASRLVAKLEAEGLLQRQAGKDRRTHVLKVSPAGRRELAALEGALAVLDGRVRSHLSAAEQATLAKLCERLQRRLLAEET